MPGESLLFCDPRFHDLNGVAPAELRRFEHQSGGERVGVLEGVLRDGVFESGFSAPFGGPNLTRPDWPIGDVLVLLQLAVTRLREEGVRTIRIKLAPGAYSGASPVVEYLLFHLGFAVEHCDINQHVELEGFETIDDYLGSLKKKRARDVRVDLAEPFVLQDADDPAEVAECHRILAANRAAHGRPEGLPAEYISKVGETFPARIHRYLLAHAATPVAAAIVYRVLPDVDLLVAWGDDGHALQRSPMNFLAYKLVERSLATGARLLDLGPSSEKDGAPNPGLIQFKRSVGARPGTRLVLVLSRRP